MGKLQEPAEWATFMHLHHSSLIFTAHCMKGKKRLKNKEE